MNLVRLQPKGNGGSSDIKPFIVNFDCDNGYINQTITMIFKGVPHQGEVVENVSGIVGTDGKLTLYPMHDGKWEISSYSTISGAHSEEITLEKWGNYNKRLIDTPNGETAEPNNVKTWLNCANIWDKSYTDIAQVLADTSTLNMLVDDNNANIYLARSTSWISTVLADNSFRSLLLARSSEKGGIVDKICVEYTEPLWIKEIFKYTDISNETSGIFVTVPHTTNSPNTSKGIVTARAEYSAACKAHMSFNGNKNKTGANGYWQNSNLTPSWIGFDFNDKTCVCAFEITNVNNATYAIPPYDFSLEATNNDDWDSAVPVELFTTSTGDKTIGKTTKYYCTNFGYYKKYRLLIRKAGNQEVAQYSNIAELQFYGREE